MLFVAERTQVWSNRKLKNQKRATSFNVYAFPLKLFIPSGFGRQAERGGLGFVFAQFSIERS